MSTGHSVNEEQLQTQLSSRIAQYKMPQHFIVRADLPSNASGKLDRTSLAAAAQQFLAARG
jgi:fatty-acyl-CoA synthase